MTVNTIIFKKSLLVACKLARKQVPQNFVHGEHTCLTISVCYHRLYTMLMSNSRQY